MNVRIAAGLAAALLAYPAFAAPAAVPAGDDSGEAELRALLAEETAVATKTKVNSDFVPGVVTVLHGEDLEEMGIETAWEALSLVPGMIPVRNALGDPTVVVRGFQFPFSLKILIDGVALSRESAGINGIALQIPVQQIDRIEVIRGPGSVVYGDNAFLGLVNVVTRRTGARAYVRWGGDHALSGGPQYLGTPAPGWEIGAEGAAWKSTDAPVASPLEADEKRGWGEVYARRGGFSLTGEAITRRLDPSGLPATDQTHQAVEGRWAGDVVRDLHLELHAGWLHNRFRTTPTEFTGSVGAYGVDADWTGWDRHDVVFALSFEHGTIDRASQQLPPLPPLPPPPPLVIRDRIRDDFGATLQDTFRLSDALTATGGLRYDRFSDIGNRTTPRISLVWKASESQIVKLQYAEGFRAPSFFELYSRGTLDPSLSPETNRTWELSYVVRRPQSVGRATFFRTRIDDVIFPDLAGPPPPVFTNRHHARADGVELEWEQQLAGALRVLANASYTNPKDDRTADLSDATPVVASRWSGNAALLWRIRPSTHADLRWNWVGPRNAAAPARNGGYSLVDLAATRKDLFLPGLRLEAGVKNVLDRKLRYLDPGRPGEAPRFLEFPGRTYFAQISWAR